ncbi:MAG: TrkA family potassium uptake protein [Chloroflexi bacterium]|nr:TrkA family potassium uptake protein [Chloroflexota bacterium]
MYIIVVGGGKVGFHLAKALVAEGHEILVLERDSKKCEAIADELGSVVVHGDGCEAATLADAGAARADVMVAVTGDDEDNLVVCQVAKLKFNVPRTIARINNPKNELIFRKLGIGETVSSTQVIMERIQSELPSHPLLHLLDLRQYGLELVDIKLTRGSASVGKRLRDLKLPASSVVPLIISKRQGVLVPNGDTVLEDEDEVVAVTRTETEDALRAQFTGS